LAAICYLTAGIRCGQIAYDGIPVWCPRRNRRWRCRLGPARRAPIRVDRLR
jgi:hypothetical protein